MSSISMNEERITRIASELIAKAPQMGKGQPSWRDLKVGERFKYKRKWWIKKTKTKMVEDYDPQTITVRNNVLPR
jgi:hypothetical protein